MTQFDCINKLLEKVFYKYGKLIARYPLPFIIVPILVTGILAFGLKNIYTVSDAEELYAPTNGPAKDERQLVNKYFPQNDSYAFIPTRRTIRDGSLQIILTKKDGGSVYTKEGISIALQVDNLVRGIEVNDSKKNYDFTELCAAWKGECEDNAVLLLLNKTQDNVDVISLTYPFHNNSRRLFFIGHLLGGVKLKQVDQVYTAEALYLVYRVRYQTDKEKTLADSFLRKSVEKLQEFQTENIDVDYRSSLSLDDELTVATDGIGSSFAITYSIIMVFASVSCNMIDPVRAKGWVAFGGEIAAGLAILSAIGMLGFFGVPFTSTVGSVPFLIMGIGIDDMFVIVSSWRHTSYTWSVEERMGKTFETAAISITVTSITDVLAFGIGAWTDFKAVTYFCAYAGVAVIFSYLYAITFCAACLAYSGKIEHQNRHSSACFVQALPVTNPEYSSKPGIFKACCTGGDDIHVITPELQEVSLTDGTVNGTTPQNEKIQLKENKQNSAERSYPESPDDKQAMKRTYPESPKDLHYSTPLATELIRDYISKFILHPACKIFILVLYVVYISFAIWGCVSLQEGLHVKNLAPDGSYVVDFYDNYDHYFYRQYGPKVMVVFTDDPLDYYKKSVQDDIQNQLQRFRESKYFVSEDNLTESWLNEFSSYLKRTNQVPGTMNSFIDILRNDFLKLEPYERFVVDISFNDNFSAITASRFMIQAKGITTSLDERDLMQDARRIAADSSYDITVFAAGFIFYDQYVVIAQNTLRNLGIAVVCMMVVSVILLPSLVGIVFVTLSVVSICTGVVGFMVLWGVNLDSISMINLIMCIGFSVDFSAHICYHFSVSNHRSGNGRAMEALTYVGWPIIQGALSTILGVVVLATSDSYIFRTFFKLMFLVMVFGFIHAFFILPVVLSCTQFVMTCGDQSVTLDNSNTVKNTAVHSPLGNVPVEL